MDRAVQPPDPAVGSVMVTILESVMSGPTARMWAMTVSPALMVPQFGVIGPFGGSDAWWSDLWIWAG